MQGPLIMGRAAHSAADLEVIRAIGQRIQQRREALGLSRAALSARLERKNSGQVTEWETGHTAPGALRLIALSRALNCTVDWLLRGNEGVPGPVAIEEED